MTKDFQTDKIAWGKLKYFYYVAKFGSFTGASKHLLLSQPALICQILGLYPTPRDHAFLSLIRQNKIHPILSHPQKLHEIHYPVGSQ